MAEKLADLLGQPVERCREALQRCNNDEEKATDYLLTNEDKPAEFWMPTDKKVIEFERWGEKFARVDENTLSEIIVTCVESGKPFVDPSFPPEDVSLFFDPEIARSVWKCHDCNRDNPLPPENVIEAYRNRNPSSEQVRSFFQYIAATNPALAVNMQKNPQLATRLLVESFGPQGAMVEDLVCKLCHGKFPLGAIDSKPTQWLRPIQVRDDITIQYGAGAPWKIIRDSVRPDDVRQGAVGNCWFVGALTILARQKPDFIHKLIPFNPEYNEYGAYLVRLCKDGQWTNVIVDDNLPCTRNKTLCYTTAARRQLWVPLIEKAAAKLSGCYEGMHAGTLCEAFGLLTGFATERELLKPDISIDDTEVLWARVVSAHSAGFLIGLACSEKPRGNNSGSANKPAKTMKDLHQAGLQAPHAYILLDTRELPISGERLIQLGNPWGDRSPGTWKGPWGKSSMEFKEAVRQGQLPRPSNEVNPNGDFWMSWSDVLEHFATIEICRAADSELVHEIRVRGWLPALSGLGDVFEFDTGPSSSGKIRLDLSLYQEGNLVRESAQGAVSTNVDLGFVILRNNSTAAAFVKRQTAPEVSEEVFLDANSKYTIVPLSFSNISIVEHRKVTLAIRTTSHVHVTNVRTIKNEPNTLRAAMFEYMRLMDPEIQTLVPGIAYSMIKDDCGAVISCENRTTCIGCQASIDADDSVGMSSTRGVLITTDIIPPGRRMILGVLTPKKSLTRYRLNVTFSTAPLDPQVQESHMPSLREDEDLPEILELHRCELLPRNTLHTFQALVRIANQPNHSQFLMHLSVKRNQAIAKLQAEYVSAGIAASDAFRIACEEVEFMHVP